MKILLHFPIFYCLDAPRWLLRFLPRFLIYLEDRLAILLNVRMFFVPLFQDTSLIGRFLSLIFRAFRILFGVLVLIFSAALLLAAVITWLAFPFLLIFFLKIKAILVLFLFFLVYFFLRKDKPLAKISGSSRKDTVQRVATGSVRRILAKPLTPSILISFLASLPQVKKFWNKAGVDAEKFLREFSREIRRADVQLDKKVLFERALKFAVSLDDFCVSSRHLFLSLVEESEILKKVLLDLGVAHKDLYLVAQWIKREEEIKRKLRVWNKDFVLKSLGGVNRDWTARVTPTLDRFGTDLTRMAQEGKLPKMVGKEKTIEEALRVLSRSTRDHVLILGEAGCGKSIMVKGLAQKIIEGGADRALFSKRIVSLNLSRLLADTKAAGEVEGRLVKILDETAEAGNVILFVDEIHNLAGMSEASFNVFNTFEPYLSSSAFQTIGAATWENYRRFIEPNSAFASLFQVVNLPEATVEEAIEVLEIVALELEKKQKVAISFPAITSAVDLSRRFIHYRVLPDKAVAVLEEAAAAVTRKRPGGVVAAEDVAEIVASKTSIPVTQITKEESDKLLNLEEKMHERVIDQNTAISAIADAMRRARVGLKEEKRPICALLFVGPTGVGKTEMAKALAEAYFGNEETMVRLDMSEFQTKTSIAKLLGSSPSGSFPGSGGVLTEAVRRRPFALLLLDEIEKAHPDILNVFLAVIDDGRATDGMGRVVRFSNTIIIATSNAGTYLFDEEEKRGWAREETKEKLRKEELPRFFKPEFLNRFDGIIICESLTRKDILKIVNLKLKKLAEKMAQKHIFLTFKNDFVEELAEKGYQPTMGVRPLRRLIADSLESYLAKKMLAGEIKKGDSVELGKEVLA